MNDKEMNGYVATYFEQNGVEKTLRMLVSHITLIAGAMDGEIEATGNGFVVTVEPVDE